MDLVYKNITLAEAKKLIEKIKADREYHTLAKDLEYFVNLQDEKITNTVLDELQNLMTRIKKLLELDAKIKEKENIISLFEDIASEFKEQQIRAEDLSKISNGELFKVVEELDLGTRKEIKDLDLIFITRTGANKYTKEHKAEYNGILKIKVIDNKDPLLEKVLKIIEENY